MERLSLPAFEEVAEEFNEEAYACGDLDPFCSSTNWSLCAHRIFGSNRFPYIFRSDSGFVALARNTHPVYGRWLEPLETNWGLGCPLVGRNPEVLAKEFVQTIEGLHRFKLPLFFMGLKVESPRYYSLATALTTLGPVRVFEPTRTYRASLEGGYEGFLSRRKAQMRGNLRRSERLGRERGLSFEHHLNIDSLPEARALFVRCMAVESKSWKGLGGTGLLGAGMGAFYLEMFKQLVPRSQLRMIFATCDGEDVGFIFGAVIHGIFRGLQMSYIHRPDIRRISTGSLLQLQMIQQVAGEGCTLYDLGMELAYKEHWGEDVVEAVMIRCL